MNRLFLSRRNLFTLIHKLDRVRDGDFSSCSIVKYDDRHPKYPQTMDSIIVEAVENEEYYDRPAGNIQVRDQSAVEYMAEVSLELKNLRVRHSTVLEDNVRRQYERSHICQQLYNYGLMLDSAGNVVPLPTRK